MGIDGSKSDLGEIGGDSTEDSDRRRNRLKMDTIGDGLDQRKKGGIGISPRHGM
jgi:hypothetical protein